MKDCIFCQIVTGSSPAYKIYEDESFLAFLDIYPFGWGHTQLIPKKHYQYVWNIPHLDHFFLTAQKLIQHYNKVSSTPSSFAFVIGELIPHAHLQILPKTPENHRSVKKAFSQLRQPQIDPQIALTIQEQLKLD